MKFGNSKISSKPNYKLSCVQAVCPIFAECPFYFGHTAGNADTLLPSHYIAPLPKRKILIMLKSMRPLKRLLKADPVPFVETTRKESSCWFFKMEEEEEVICFVQIVSLFYFMLLRPFQ
jgi:hypothetical protein